MLLETLFALILPSATCDCPFAKSIIIGHRGSGVSTAAKPYAENTLPSFAAALEAGADFIETDIQLSADGYVVLHHDFTLDDTTNLRGCVAQKTVDELKSANATNGSGSAQPTGIPLLSEALALVREKGGRINIEVKVNTDPKTCPPTDIQALVEAAVADVHAAGMDDRVLFSSFSFAAMEAAKRLAPGIAVAYLTADAGAALLASADRAKTAGFEAINPIYFSLSQDGKTFSILREKGLAIYPWTVNEEPALLKLIEGGVTGVITDDVGKAIAARAKACQRYVCPAQSKSKEESGCAAAGRVDAAAIGMVVAWLFLRQCLVTQKSVMSATRLNPASWLSKLL